MLENSINELTAVCRDLLAELRARPIAPAEHTAPDCGCEATLVEIETPDPETPAPQATAPVPAAEPAPAEQAEPMSTEDFASIGAKLTNELKQTAGVDAMRAVMAGLYSSFEVKNPMALPAERRREFIAAIETAIIEARHG